MPYRARVVNRVSCGSFGCNFGVNENCNVIILADKVKAAVMQSNDDLNEETFLVNDVLRRNSR